MKLYVCWGTFQTFGPGHPCRNALDALYAVGHDPEVIRSHGWGLLPAALNRSEGRRLAREATGRSWIPLLLTDSGDMIAGSSEIRAWAAEHPANRRPPPGSGRMVQAMRAGQAARIAKANIRSASIRA